MEWTYLNYQPLLKELFLLAEPLIIQTQQNTASVSLTCAWGLSLTVQNWLKNKKEKEKNNPTGLHTTETSYKQDSSSEKSHAMPKAFVLASHYWLSFLPHEWKHYARPSGTSKFIFRFHYPTHWPQCFLPLTNKISPSPPNCSIYT